MCCGRGGIGVSDEEGREHLDTEIFRSVDVGEELLSGLDGVGEAESGTEFDGGRGVGVLEGGLELCAECIECGVANFSGEYAAGEQLQALVSGCSGRWLLEQEVNESGDGGGVGCGCGEEAVGGSGEEVEDGLRATALLF